PFNAVVKRSDEEGHDPDLAYILEEILQPDDLQFDRMLRNMGHRIVEEPITVMLDDVIDERPIDGGDAERRAEILPGHRESNGRIMRRADDDKQLGIGHRRQIAVAPGISLMPPPKVDVRRQERPQSALSFFLP